MVHPPDYMFVEALRMPQLWHIQKKGEAAALCQTTQLGRETGGNVSHAWAHGYVCDKCSHHYRKLLDAQPDPTQALGNLLARIFGDGGQTQNRLGYEESLRKADDILSHLNLLETATQKYVAVQAGTRADIQEAQGHLLDAVARLRARRGFEHG
jgi:hypothetical protein